MTGFGTDEFFARQAARAETAEIQAFNEANPDYWILTHGHPPPADDAVRAFDFRPPEDMTYSELRWFLIRNAQTNSIVGQVSDAINLLAGGVHHLGFFMVETRRQGTGFAQRHYDAWERNALGHGARWLRLGVVERNERGRRFWSRNGFVEVKRRDDFVLGDLTHTLFIMVKPLGSNTLATYLDVVPRDRADRAS